MAMADGLYIADYKAIAIAIGHRVKVLNLRQNGDASWHPGARFCIFAMWPVKNRGETLPALPVREGNWITELYIVIGKL